MPALWLSRKPHSHALGSTQVSEPTLVGLSTAASSKCTTSAASPPKLYVERSVRILKRFATIADMEGIGVRHEHAVIRISTWPHGAGA